MLNSAASSDPVLVREWHAVLKSEELTDSPVRVNIMEERAVVFRTGEGISALKDLCVHRGTLLSLGTVQDDCIVCPYHGWAFDGSGRCVRIPSQAEEDVIPVTAQVPAYACREAYGLIWVCLSDDPAPFPVYGEYEEYGYSLVTGPFRVQAAAPRIVENFLDVAHLMFVHAGVLGDPEHTIIPDYTVEKTDIGLATSEIKVRRPLRAGERLLGGNPEIIYLKRVLRPLTASLRQRSEGTGERRAMLLCAVPVRPNESVVHFVLTRNYRKGDAEFDRKQIENNRLVFGQDIVILENQKPEELPIDLHAELNHRSDMMSIAYRRWLKELGMTFGVV